MSLFHFSPLNYDLVQSTPSGSLNILWNQLNQKSIANSMMYMTPTFNFSIGYEYPEFGMFGNNLLNPILAIQQTLQAFQNGSWMNGMNGMNGMNNWGNWQMPWNTPWGNSNNNSSTNSSEYDALRALIVKYKETYKGKINTTLEDKINAALNKSGKPEEKLEALRDLYKQLDKDKLEKALLELPEYKIMLDAAGYKFKGTNAVEENKLKESLRKLKRDLVDRKKGDELSKIASGATSSSILRLISYWNDDHSGENERGIIRMVANNLPTEESEMELYKDGIENLTKSLLNKADELIVEYDSDFSNLEKATDAVSDAMATVEKEFTKENLLALAKEFDTLYAMLRMMEAERVRNTINTKYGFLNDISSTDKDIADDNLIVEDTKADLKNEGIKVDDIEIDTVPEEDVEEVSDIDERVDTADEKVEELVKEEELKKTARDGVYTTTQSSTNEPAKFYTVKEDKLVELKGVKSIDKDGNCTMADGSKKAQKDVETVEVTAQDVIDYNNTLERVDSLVKDGTIKPVDTSKKGAWPKSVKLYECKGLQENGKKQYFIVRGNELMQLDCEGINPGGTIVIDGNAVLFKDLTDDNFETISNSDIVTTDKKKEAGERKAQEEKDRKAQEEEEKNERYAKKLELPEVDEESQAYKTGYQISEDLVGYTKDKEWRRVKNNILHNMTSENVYVMIKSYTDDDYWFGSDNILEQIATENGRDDKEQIAMINHIIKCVLEFCDKNGSCNSESYKELDKYRNGITDEIFKDPTGKLRKIDHLILDVFSIDNY